MTIDKIRTEVHCPQVFPHQLVLEPLRRNPIQLPQATVDAVLSKAVQTIDAYQLDSNDNTEPMAKASIVVVTFNNLLFNRLCLESVLGNTLYRDYEVLVVDNHSVDGTPEYLRALSDRHKRLRVVFNGENVGFAPAVNQGIELAAGDVLVLLNNDTIVTPGWLNGLIQHLNDQTIGAVGCVTNRIGNEAQIHASYTTYGELLQFSQELARQHQGEAFDIRMLAMFCMALRRDVYNEIGPLDEQFKIGTLEDDDYSLRLHAAGYHVVCVEHVFVHHFGKASFGKLIPSGEFAEILKQNRARFEQKWGQPWQPYQRRRSKRYEQSTTEMKKVVRRTIPPGGIVVVISKGDEQLLQLDGHSAWHFPQSENGQFAGCYPASCDEAIAQLESIRCKGAQYLLVPSVAFWWLEHYPRFASQLTNRHTELELQTEVCRIFALQKPGNL